MGTDVTAPSFPSPQHGRCPWGDAVGVMGGSNYTLGPVCLCVLSCITLALSPSRDGAAPGPPQDPHLPLHGDICSAAGEVSSGVCEQGMGGLWGHAARTDCSPASGDGNASWQDKSGSA